jgi:CheY-like chemotaxis protein
MNGLAFELLLIEDDPAGQKLVRESLGPAIQSPYRLDIEDRLDDGMRRLAERRYDAVLVSLTLTEDPGLESYLRLRESFPEVPTIVLTRPGAEILGIKAMDLGAMDALVKDAAMPEGLPRRLRYTVERHRLRTELRGLDMLDDLTGLYNRRGFVALATPVLKVARRMRSGVLLVVAAVEGAGWSAPAEEARSVRAAGRQAPGSQHPEFPVVLFAHARSGGLGGRSRGEARRGAVAQYRESSEDGVGHLTGGGTSSSPSNFKASRIRRHGSPEGSFHRGGNEAQSPERFKAPKLRSLF